MPSTHRAAGREGGGESRDRETQHSWLFFGATIGKSAGEWLSRNLRRQSQRYPCLVRWTEEDEQVSVIPASTVKPGQEVYVEAVCEFKWLGRYFEAEVLKVSGQPTIVSKH